MRILCLLSLLFLVGCCDCCKQEKQEAEGNGSAIDKSMSNVWRKKGDINDKRYFSDKRFIQVKGLDFPDYAKFDGWIGRYVEVKPVYQEGDRNWFVHSLYYEDYLDGQTEPIARKRFGIAGTGNVRTNPTFMLCLKSHEEDGLHGITMNFYKNIHKNFSTFVPFPAEATSSSYGYNLNEKLDKKVEFDDKVEIFQIGLYKKNGENGTEGCGYRKFFLQLGIDQEKFEHDSF